MFLLLSIQVRITIGSNPQCFIFPVKEYDHEQFPKAMKNFVSSHDRNIFSKHYRYYLASVSGRQKGRIRREERKGQG